ncbi:flagellar hook-associated protein 1 FlgK [Desulfonispora thiosulfatigenes DSM 11270]|uniref:Flagellar hook-associated protein 1 n=1 Tax=Desulfonispora thiosulfatigenes DSM 11270 TaxID=656914 RepID=A0A1W1UQ54_DESTI|nr:flagellar hook-associated protein FlgK [Desulfonispora thiosulfatigenes]SMB82824.1 flagellar hook-associated protein 1 FlgK [Desulfonispora thiosulfatigenes DSM 11270]
MSGLFFGINIGVKGLMAQQAAINVTSHNVANANTPGYTRQRAFMETSIPISGLGKGQLGSGVEIAEIQRLRDEFIDYQIRNETSKLGTNEAKSDALSQIETVFMEPSETGFNELMNDFWNGFQELSKYAESSPIRTTVKEVAVSLTDAFRHMSKQLTDFQTDTTKNMGIKVIDVNSLGRQIASLNDKIVNIKMSGDNPNDLLDKRDTLLNQLSGLGNITTTPRLDANGKPTGALDVKFGDQKLVDNITSNDVEFTDGKLVLKEKDGKTTDIKLADGELAGMLELNKTEGTDLGTDSIQFYKNKLDSLAVGIAKAVNEEHRKGTNLKEETGIDFFVFKDEKGDPITDLTKISAANIYLNSDIEKDVSRIAAAATPSDPGDFAKGNGEIALNIAKLQSAALKITGGNLEVTTGGGGTNFADYYKDMTAELGVATKEAHRMTENQGVLVNQLEMRQESLIGVSMDEEMANLISFQHAYQANAKVISTMDELLQTVINMVR